MKTRFKAAYTPTDRLVLNYLSNPATTTPSTVDTIASDIGSPSDSVRKTLQKLTRQNLLRRTLQHHTAFFQLMPTDIAMTRTEIQIPGTGQSFVRFTPTSLSTSD